ncbi:right-handed parallel beta-helix repeat-containing protein [Phytomonospora sp. NPDC050363]|uniref:right-handed parallel beta-helix repeat-containing protein n=1 Tax=Phytomonospora sp. NPDC050363 TaxID=3155642 RepID=UPI0033EA1273
MGVRYLCAMAVAAALGLSIVSTSSPGFPGSAEDPVTEAIPNADGLPIAWIGAPADRPSDDADLRTLQATLTAATAGQTVSFDPEDYIFSSLLSVPRQVTLASASPSVLFARFTVAQGVTADANVTFGVAVTGAVVTVSTAGAALKDIKIVNPNAVTRPTGVQLAAAATGVTIDRFTMDGGGEALSYGVNLTSGSAVITTPAISGVATGIGAAAASVAPNLAVEGGTIAATTAGIALGTTKAPRVSNVTVTGSGSGVGTGIDLANSSGAVVSSPVVRDFNRGIGATATSTAPGARITGARLTGIGREGIALGSTIGPVVTTPEIVGTDTANSIGVNLHLVSEATLDRVVVSHFAYGVSTNIGATGVGPKIISPVVSDVTVGGITLGSTQGAVITDPIVSGLGTGSGINLMNSGRVTVTDGRISGFLNGVASQSAGAADSDRTDIRLSRLEITGPPNASTGISLLAAKSPLITDITADVTGAGVVVHDSTDVVIEDLTVIGHEGPSDSTGSAILKAYGSQNVSVDRASIEAGSYGFFYSSTTGATVTNALVSNVVLYALYSRSSAEIEVSRSRLEDNDSAGVFTVTEADLPISRDIDLHDNVLSGNRDGILLYSGTRGVRFTDNTVSGQTFTISAASAHDVTIAGNEIEQAGADGLAAVMVSPIREDRDQLGSYSSSGIEIRGNTFTGSGTWLQVGSPDPSAPDAAYRTLRDPVLVVGNSFPAASTAVRNFANAVVGDDTATARVAEAGPVAVDARDYDDPNDWGAPCRPTGFLDGELVYDGEGAAVYELTEAPALYPTDCIELSLTQSIEQQSVRAGEVVTWTLTPRNEGLRDAPAGWSVTQLLPEGVELVSMSGDGYTFDGLTATAGAALPVDADGSPITVTVRVVSEPETPVTMRNVAYVAPLAPADATDLDGDGYADVVVEHRSPLEVPTLETDTDASATDNDAQGVWQVVPGGAAPTPTPTPSPTSSDGPSGSGDLAVTGTLAVTLGLTAVLLLIGGVATLAFARRRRA